MKDRTIVIIICGILAALIVPLFILSIIGSIRSDERFRAAGCEDLRWEPIPQHFLDNGYYVKDGWMDLSEVKELFESATWAIVNDCEVETMGKDPMAYCLFQKHSIVWLDPIKH